MKKLFLKMSAITASLNVFGVNAFAQGSAILDPTNAPDATAPGTLDQNITQIINYFLGTLGLVAVAFLIYAGVLMVTAGGNDEQVSKAKKIITYAAIGIIIVLLSWAIVSFVASSLG